MKKQTDIGLLILRVALGGLMLLHGIAKIRNGIDGMPDMMSGRGLPGFMAYGVYLGEVIAPIMIIIGFRSRIAGLLMMITMFIAVYVAHADQVFEVSNKGGSGIELQLLYALGALSIFFTGAGKYAASRKSAWD